MFLADPAREIIRFPVMCQAVSVFSAFFLLESLNKRAAFPTGMCIPRNIPAHIPRSGSPPHTRFIQVTAMAPGPMWHATLSDSGPSMI